MKLLSNSLQMKKTAAIFTAMLFFVLATVNSQTIYYVDASKADNTGAGTSWATAKKDLQNAITAAISGDAVWVKAGTYKPTEDLMERKPA